MMLGGRCSGSCYLAVPLLCLSILSHSVRFAVVDSFSNPTPSGVNIRDCISINTCQPTEWLQCNSADHSGVGFGAGTGTARRTQTATVGCAVSVSPGRMEEPETRGQPNAVLLRGSSRSTEEEQQFLGALKAAGYANVVVSETRLDPLETSDTDLRVYVYELSRATGMLKLLSSPSSPPSPQTLSVGGGGGAARSSADEFEFEPPRWIPIVRGEENVLVANGWSFLDPDESEPLSAFDIDDANSEGEYRPKWGRNNDEKEESGIGAEATGAIPLQLSSLGYDLSPLAEEDVLSEADSLSSLSLSPHSRGVLLHGKTDPPNTKKTCNGFDFCGSAGQSDIPEGIFVTAIGGLPLFSSVDLSPTTGSSGWLSFARPITMEASPSHVLHVDPANDSLDKRIEVVCARSRCHLGHYFGPSEGYCINASALRFVPSSSSSSIPAVDTTIGNIDSSNANILPAASKPLSWRPLDTDVLLNQQQQPKLPPSHRLLKKVLETHGRFEHVALGCGCFWHAEDALRRLHGVVATAACYAGGHTTSPTYRDVCEGSTGHAEVVSVTFDPDVCPVNQLFDCFLAMHDPTMVRAHGKQALRTGQYRSCVFVTGAETKRAARECVEDCRQQLGTELSTEIRVMNAERGGVGQGWCWRAEDRHQRRDEVVRGKLDASLPALSAVDWLNGYGRRTSSIVGSSLESSLHPDDDGMAMMMI